jgi:2-methylcitrate dehydratase PrpD
LAEFISATSLEDVPADVIERTKYLILDGLACGLFASRLPWSDIAVDAVMAVEGHANSRVWGRASTTSVLGAALLNGTLVQGFELDDYHERGPLHSQSCVLPATFAAVDVAAQDQKVVGGEAFLLASLLGFEVGPRIGMALGGLDLIARGWHCGPINGVISGSVASAKILQLDANTTEHTIGLAATQACGLMSAQYGAMVKRMHSGFAARNALWSAILASRGFTGIEDVLEREYGGLGSCFSPGVWDGEKLLSELGDRWELAMIAVKPYSCMGGLHTAVDAVKETLLREEVKGRSVESVQVGLPRAMYKHGGWKLEKPVVATAAQMNIAYVIAVALLDGDVFVDQFRPDRLNSNEVWELVQRVVIYHEPELDALGEEGRWACRLDLEFEGGVRIRNEVLHPTGSSSNPLTNDEIVQKADRLMSRVWPEAAREELKEAVLNLEELKDASRISDLLGTPATAPWS